MLNSADIQISPGIRRQISKQPLCISDAGLIPKIHKELLQLSCKKPNNLQNKAKPQKKKIWARDLDISLKKHIRMATVYEKMLNITDNQRGTN